MAAEGTDQQELHGARHGAGQQPQSLGHLRARQPERAADVLRLRAQPAGDQCAAERHAQEERQDDHGRRARRPERGRLHLREGRPRHDDGRRDRPHRRPDAAARHPAAQLHRLLHLHEVVRADPPQVRLRDRDAARALPGRTAIIAPNMRDYVVKQLKGNRDPDAGAHLRRQVRHRPAAPVHARIGQGRGRPGQGAAVGQEPAARSTAISAACTTSARSSPPSARHARGRTQYYATLRAEIEERVRLGRARSRRTATWARRSTA